ncbi:hypothetical protein A9Q98_02955 [Thalassotalea sp. 42_200_T64]|nr:hypothetical protein A9Q98_02955 [Thalassotalea sp. 42_200_T64]
MDRINEVKEQVVELYNQYLKEMNYTHRTLDIDDIASIEKEFKSVYVADTIATRNRTSFPRTLTQKLRKAFADLLLLMEGKDLKAEKLLLAAQQEGKKNCQF